jgi:hypothetical protein
MINIITKSVIAACALFTVAGAANATVVPEFTYQAGSLPANGAPNVASDNGKFMYMSKNNGKQKILYKAKGDFMLNMGGGSSYLIENGKIKINAKIEKDGTLKGTGKITGIDPFGGNKKKTLVTFGNNGDFSFLWDAGGNDLFGMSITDINCPLWDFCTNTETFYAIGEFGTDPAKINVKDGVLGVTTVPVPAAVWLFGSGLLGLAGMARGRRGKKAA